MAAQPAPDYRPRHRRPCPIGAEPGIRKTQWLRLTGKGQSGASTRPTRLRYDSIYRDSVILTERAWMRPPRMPHGEHGRHGHWAGGRVPKGNVRGLLLAALLDSPAHGYELMRRPERPARGRWRPSPGAVHPL